MRFAPEYVEYVLRENFEDAKVLFLSPLLAIHCAHLVMLVDRHIVSRADARRMREALDAISLPGVRAAVFDGTCEDLFFHVEGLIAGHCGEDVAGRLHVARSRNDIDMTMYRMRQRELILLLLAATHDLRRPLLALAAKHRKTVFAAHTHTQPAQPTTVAHYLLAIVEQLERDAVRVRAAFETTNRNPLGSCVMTGTGFPIDRELTSALLGFAGPTGNTYGSIATVDYLLESASAAAVALVGLGRVLQDLLLWCTAEFGYLRLDDGFVQSSSIMPQKRNPVALEHGRALASKALAQAAAIPQMVHNTPFGDTVDTEDDLQPLVASMFRDATRAFGLVGAVMERADFDTVRLETGAHRDWITVTELADTLTREHDLPFRRSHAVVAQFVAACEARPTASRAALLDEAATSLLGRPIRYSDARLEEILSPHHFVDIRRVPGGPAPDVTGRALTESQAVLERDDGWLAGARATLTVAEQRLQERKAAL